MEISLAIGYISLLFIIGSFIAKLADRIGIPDIPLLLIIGLLIGPVLGVISPIYAQTIFSFVGTVGLIILLLVGAFEMRWIVLKKVLKTVLKLDTIGLVISLLISGLIFSFVYALPFTNPIGFIYGAVNCATDPATLIPIFSKSDIDPKIAVTLEAESVFNDPLGIVATTLTLSAIGLSKSVNPILDFIMLAFGGLVLGYVGGKIFEFVVSKDEFGEYIAPLGVGAAMALWYFGEDVVPHFLGHGLSGYMAVAIMGLYIGNVVTKNPKNTKDMHKMAEFCTDLSSLTRILIFVFLGASISLPLLKSFGLYGLLCAFGSVFIARPIGVFAATAIPPVSSLKERIYFALEGPRGVVPAALAAMIYSSIMHNPSVIPPSVTQYMPAEMIAGSILVATFLTILLSVIVEASWAYPLANKLFK